MVNTEHLVKGNRRISPKNYIHTGAVETLKALLSGGHDVTVWTNAYAETVYYSRLGILRRDLPKQEKKRFAVATAVSYEEDKMVALPFLFDKARCGNFSSIVIIDNTREKLERAAQVIKDFGIHNDMTCLLVWVNNELPFKSISPCSLSPEVPLMSIPSLTEITSLMNDGDLLQDFNKTLFLVDFNDTIIDTKKWKRCVEESNQSRDSL